MWRGGANDYGAVSPFLFGVRPCWKSYGHLLGHTVYLTWGGVAKGHEREGGRGVIGKIYIGTSKICIKLHCIPRSQTENLCACMGIPLDIGEATNSKNTLLFRALWRLHLNILSYPGQLSRLPHPALRKYNIFTTTVTAVELPAFRQEGGRGWGRGFIPLLFIPICVTERGKRSVFN